MSSFPLAEVRRAARRVEKLEPEPGDEMARCPWEQTRVLACTVGFSFETQERVPFAAPALGECPPKGTELPRGPRKKELVFKSVWAQQEVGMMALAEETSKSGIAFDECFPSEEVIFVGNVARLIEACRRVAPRKVTVYQLLRVNNIIHVVSRETERVTQYWNPGNTLEQLWTKHCDKNIGNYVFFRGKIGGNTVIVPSQVDAVRAEGEMDFVEIKLGRISRERSAQTFVQCHFKGVSKIDYVEQAHPCKYHLNGYCSHGEQCGYEHVRKKISSEAKQEDVELFRPEWFDRDMNSVDKLLTRLKTVVEIGKSCVLVVELDGSMSFLSDICLEGSPWMKIPSLFGRVSFTK